MEASWLNGNTVRSGTLTYTRGANLHETVSNVLTLQITGIGINTVIKIDFPVGDTLSGALFSQYAAILADCVPPEGFAVSKEIAAGFLSFSLRREAGAHNQDGAVIRFESLLCDTGEGVSMVRVTCGSTVNLPVLRVVSDCRVSFFGDVFGDYMTDIKLGWRAENTPPDTKLYLVPGDTVSGELELQYMEGEISLPLLCDTTYMLIVRAGDMTVETLFHTVKIRSGAVLEFRARDDKGKLYVHYLLKNRRHAYLNRGIGRLESTVYEKYGDIYAEYDGVVTPYSDGGKTALIWPPDFEISPVYLQITGICGVKTFDETRYGAIEVMEGSFDFFSFRLENPDAGQSIQFCGEPWCLSITANTALARIYDVIYRLCYASVGWLGWAKNGERAGISGKERRCVGIEARLVRKEWSQEITAVPDQLPCFIDDDEAMLAVKGAMIAKYTMKPKVLPYGDVQIERTNGVRITLTNGADRLYDIYYRILFFRPGNDEGPVSTGWAKNGGYAGFLNGGFTDDRMELELVVKGAEPPFPAYAYPAFIDFQKAFVTVQAFSDEVSWFSEGAGGQRTLEAALPLTGFRLIAETVPGLEVLYKGCYTNTGWDQDFCAGGAVSERKGEFLEGVLVVIRGESAALFCVACRVYAENIGWLGWDTEGQACGLIGQGVPITAVDVRLVPRQQASQFENIGYGALPCGFYGDARLKCSFMMYGTWFSGENGLAGQPFARGEGIRNIKPAIVGIADSGVKLRRCYGDTWENDWISSPDGVTATTDVPLKAVALQLTGVAEKLCDLVYRVYDPDGGWLGWAANGAPAGGDYPKFSFSALECKLLTKGLISREAKNTQPAFVSLSGCNVECEVYDGEVWSASDLARDKPVEDIRFAIEGIYHHFDGSLRIWLDGSLNQYDIFYRVRLPGAGWLGWAKNGDVAGAAGCKPPNGMDVKLIKKGGDSSPCDSRGLPAFVDFASVKIQADMQWSGPCDVADQYVNGFKLALSGAEGLSVEYMAYYDKYGWGPSWVTEGEVCCRDSRLEAVKVRKIGPASTLYDLFYRLHIGGFGWLGWTNCGDAGIISGGYSCTNMEFRLRPKRTVARGFRFNHPPAFVDTNKLAVYRAFTSGDAWVLCEEGGCNAMLGNKDSTAPLTGVQICLDGVTDCQIEYKCCYSASGWESMWNTCPLGLDTGADRGNEFLEAVKIQLNKGAEALFEIQYRVYTKESEWLPWVSDGAESGVRGQPCFAIEIKLKLRNQNNNKQEGAK